MEFFSQSNDCSLFCYGSHSKKRPNNIVLGRLFNHQMLDMVELEMIDTTFRSMEECSADRKSCVFQGGKPMFLFLGEDFATKPHFQLFQQYILDFFRGEALQELNLAGLNRVIICSSVRETITFKHCAIRLKKSGTKYPNVELEDIGPFEFFIVFLFLLILNSTVFFYWLLRLSHCRSATYYMFPPLTIGPCFDLKIRRVKEADKEVMSQVFSYLIVTLVISRDTGHEIAGLQKTQEYRARCHG